MTPQRLIMIFLMSIQAVAFAVMFGGTAFAVGVVLITIIGCLGRIELDLSRERKQLWVLAIFAVMSLKLIFSPVESNTRTTLFMDYNMGYTLCQLLMLLQVASLFARWPKRALPAAILLFSAGVMILCGRVIADDVSGDIFMFLAWLYVGIAGYYAVCDPRLIPSPIPRTPRKAMAILILLPALSFLIASGVDKSLRYLESDVARMLGEMISRGRITAGRGFSDNAALGSLANVKDIQRQRTALRVYSDTPPGYMRAKVYTTYEKNLWSTDLENRDLEPGLRDSIEGFEPTIFENVFTLMEPSNSSPQTYQVWPELKDEDAIFAPGGAFAVVAESPALVLNEAGVPAFPEDTGGGDYSIFTALNSEAPSLSDADRSLYTAVPDSLDPAVLPLARSIFEGCTDTASKIAAVENYFTTHYSYHFGIRIPAGQEPLNYFLLEKPPAHCEYFASGAAVLLRLAGVPARYVTGFVATERNPIGEYWMARYQDAHAWVEAYDETRGWTLVEATPPEGVPSGPEASRLGYLWDSLKQSFKKFRAWLAGLNPGGWIAGIQNWIQEAVGFFLESIWGGVLLIAALAAVAIVSRRRRIKARQADPVLASLQELLQKMDRRLQQAGLIRLQHETLHQFAQRITAERPGAYTEQANWYRNYATARYSGQLNDGDVERLREGVEG